MTTIFLAMILVASAAGVEIRAGPVAQKLQTETERQRRTDHGRAAERNERQRHALRRDETQIHRDMNTRLHDEQRHQSRSGKLLKRIVQAARARQSAERERAEQSDNAE